MSNANQSVFSWQPPDDAQQNQTFEEYLKGYPVDVNADRPNVFEQATQYYNNSGVPGAMPLGQMQAYYRQADNEANAYNNLVMDKNARRRQVLQNTYAARDKADAEAAKASGMQSWVSNIPFFQNTAAVYDYNPETRRYEYRLPKDGGETFAQALQNFGAHFTAALIGDPDWARNQQRMAVSDKGKDSLKELEDAENYLNGKTGDLKTPPGVQFSSDLYKTALTASAHNPDGLSPQERLRLDAFDKYSREHDATARSAKAIRDKQLSLINNFKKNYNTASANFASMLDPDTIDLAFLVPGQMEGPAALDMKRATDATFQLLGIAYDSDFPDEVRADALQKVAQLKKVRDAYGRASQYIKSGPRAIANAGSGKGAAWLTPDSYFKRSNPTPADKGYFWNEIGLTPLSGDVGDNVNGRFVNPKDNYTYANLFPSSYISRDESNSSGPRTFFETPSASAFFNEFQNLYNSYSALYGWLPEDSRTALNNTYASILSKTFPMRYYEELAKARLLDSKAVSYDAFMKQVLKSFLAYGAAGAFTPPAE